MEGLVRVVDSKRRYFSPPPHFQCHIIYAQVMDIYTSYVDISGTIIKIVKRCKPIGPDTLL